MSLNEPSATHVAKEEINAVGAVNQQCREFDKRCRTLPEYAVYRTEEWLKKNKR